MKKVLVLFLSTLFIAMSIPCVVHADKALINSNENTPPNPPEISGPASGKIKKEYNYSFLLTDPDGDSLSKIRIEWGGLGTGNITEICWTCTTEGPKLNGTLFVMQHDWKRSGEYSIRAKVWDIHNLESNWSEPMPITMPYAYHPVQHFIELLSQRFPIAFPLLRQLTGN